MFRKLAAECFGTFWLVFGGCGSALIAAGFPEVGIGLLGVSLAFGLTVLTMAYALGPISGGHFNPAVSLGLVVGGRFPAAELIPYWVAQVVGAVIAAAAALRDRERAGGLDGAGRLRVERLWRGLAGRLFDDLGLPDRGDPDGGLPCRDPRGHGARAVCGRRADRDRACAHAHSPCLDPGDEHLGQSGAVDGRGAVRRRPGAVSSCGCSGRRR